MPPFCQTIFGAILRNKHFANHFPFVWFETREMEYKEQTLFIEIYWSLVRLVHFMTFTILNSTQHLNNLYRFMDLMFVLEWIKSVIGCALYIFHLSSWSSQLKQRKHFVGPVVGRSETKWVDYYFNFDLL